MPGVKVFVGGGSFLEGDDVELTVDLARGRRVFSNILPLLHGAQF